MARYRTEIRTPLDRAEAFDRLARVERFSSWDPGVVRSSQTGGDGPGLGATYELVVRNLGQETAMPYEVVSYRPQDEYTMVGTTSTLTSTDTISVRTDGDGSVVTYDAVLDLKGPLRLFDPVLALAFRRIGDRAAAGLRRELEAS